MNAIRTCIAHARRRTFLQYFLQRFFLLSILGLALALLAVSVPKVWPIAFLQRPADAQLWYWCWVGGGVGLALSISLALAWYRRGSKMETALEIDKRFRLRERISSAISLNAQDRERPAGECLLADAVQRAETLEISEKFPIRVGRWAFSIFIPLLGLAAISFVANRTIAPKTADEKLTNEARARITEAAKQSKMQIQSQLKPEKPSDSVTETEKLIAQKLDDLTNDKLESQKDVLIKLSDMQNEVDRQLSKLGDVSALKKEFSRLDAKEASTKDLADALKDGNFEKANQAVKDLSQKIKAGLMDQQALEKMSRDLSQMAKSLEQAKKEFEQKQADLNRDLQKALAENNTERAEQIKRQLEDLQQKRRQMEQLEQLAKKMQGAANQLAKEGAPSKADRERKKSNAGGNQQQAQKGDQQQQAQPGDAKESEAAGNKAPANEVELDEMEALAEQIADLESDMDQGERLNKMSECIGGLKAQCQNKDGPPGEGLGEGKGMGQRPFEEDKANVYKSQVRSPVKPGETTKYGTAEGPNAPGVSREALKEQIAAAQVDEVDPFKDQKLNKAERDHLREYYQKLRAKQ